MKRFSHAPEAKPAGTPIGRRPEKMRLAPNGGERLSGRASRTYLGDCPMGTLWFDSGDRCVYLKTAGGWAGHYCTEAEWEGTRRSMPVRSTRPI